MAGKLPRQSAGSCLVISNWYIMILGSLERYGSHPAGYRAMPSDKGYTLSWCPSLRAAFGDETKMILLSEVCKYPFAGWIGYSPRSNVFSWWDL